MKCIWSLVFLAACLSQTLMALSNSPDSNQVVANESPLDETPLYPIDDSNRDQDNEKEEETVTALPGDDGISEHSETEENNDESEELEVEDSVEKLIEDMESKRAARGLELGTWAASTGGKQMRHRPGQKMKVARPRRGQLPTKYGPPPPPPPPQAMYSRPTTMYGPPVYRGYNQENMMVKMPMRYPYEEKMIMMKREKNSQRMPSRPVTVMTPPVVPQVVYGGPIPIPFGPSDASYQLPLSPAEVKLAPSHLMHQSLPAFPPQNFREEFREPINHANYETIIPVTEPSVENIQSSVSPLDTMTPSTLSEFVTSISNFKFAPNEAAPSDLKVINNLPHNEFDTSDEIDIRKPTFDYELPLNYYGLAYTPESLHYGGKYKFGYRVTDHESGNDFGHEEGRDGELTDGRYHVLLPDGRVQNVNYHADRTGYHADVSYKKGQRQQMSVELFNRERDFLNRERELQLERERELQLEREQLYAPYQK